MLEQLVLQVLEKGDFKQVNTGSRTCIELTMHRLKARMDDAQSSPAGTLSAYHCICLHCGVINLRPADGLSSPSTALHALKGGSQKTRPKVSTINGRW